MEQYIQVEGKRIPQSEFYKKLAEQQIKNFAYDSQLSLFPEPAVENARKQVKEQLDSGKSIDVVVIQK